MSNRAIQIGDENVFSRYSNLCCIVTPVLFPPRRVSQPQGHSGWDVRFLLAGQKNLAALDTIGLYISIRE
jgi:hypothetical protein